MINEEKKFINLWGVMKTKQINIVNGYSVMDGKYFTYLKVISINNQTRQNFSLSASNIDLKPFDESVQ